MKWSHALISSTEETLDGIYKIGIYVSVTTWSGAMIIRSLEKNIVQYINSYRNHVFLELRGKDTLSIELHFSIQKLQ